MAMSRSTTLFQLFRRFNYLGMANAQTLSVSYCTMVQAGIPDKISAPSNDAGSVRKHPLGYNVSRRDKISFLVKTLLDLKDSKEEVYGTLDAWVAWEQEFPIGALKNVLIVLEKEQQWRRIIQVIKWMLSKGQGRTMNTYGMLIRALDMDHRVGEAHEVWMKKIGSDLHSVPWQLCNVMISVYYRNLMMEDLVKLFKGIEAYDRKPPEKSIIQKVANAYELLGLPEEKERVLEKYKYLLADTWNGQPKQSRKSHSQKRAKSGQHHIENSNNATEPRLISTGSGNDAACSV